MTIIEEKSYVLRAILSDDRFSKRIWTGGVFICETWLTALTELIAWLTQLGNSVEKKISKTGCLPSLASELYHRGGLGQSGNKRFLLSAWGGELKANKDCG